MPISKIKRIVDAPQYPRDYGYNQSRLRSLRTYVRKSHKKLSRNRLYTPMGRSFPSVMNMKFTFNKTFTLVSTGLNLNYNQFRLNSIWDPDYAIGSNQLKASPWNEMNSIF